MNKAMKYAKKNLTRLGCVVEREGDRSIDFRFPSGRAWTCNNKTPLSIVQNVVASVEDYTHSRAGDRMSEYPVLREAPSLEGVHLVRTKHFVDRLELMTEQGLTLGELRGAIYKPSSVRVDNDVLIYCRGRVAIVVGVGAHADGGRNLVTLLWTQDKLWEAMPRPEMGAFSG